MSEFNKKITSEFFNDNKNIKSIKDTKEILTSIYENINKSMSDIEKKKSKLTTLLQQFNQAVGDDNVDDIKRYLETYKDYIDYLTKYLNTSLKDIAPFKQVTTVTAEEYFK
jgi:chromosome segregation ATPase